MLGALLYPSRLAGGRQLGLAHPIRRGLPHTLAQPGVNRIGMHARMPEHGQRSRRQAERHSSRVHARAERRRAAFLDRHQVSAAGDRNGCREPAHARHDDPFEPERRESLLDPALIHRLTRHTDVRGGW